MNKCLSFLLQAIVLGACLAFASTANGRLDAASASPRSQSGELSVEVQDRLIRLLTDELWGKDDPFDPSKYRKEDPNRVPTGDKSWESRPNTDSKLRIKVEHVAVVLYGDAEFQAQAADKLTEVLLRRMAGDLYGNSWESNSKVLPILNSPGSRKGGK